MDADAASRQRFARNVSNKMPIGGGVDIDSRFRKGHQDRAGTKSQLSRRTVKTFREGQTAQKVLDHHQPSYFVYHFPRCFAIALDLAPEISRPAAA
jgi:hypothetical protein